jgi:hypothetical protein
MLLPNARVVKLSFALLLCHLLLDCRTRTERLALASTTAVVVPVTGVRGGGVPARIIHALQRKLTQLL